MPVREKGEGGPVRSRHVPSHVPSHPQNAAKVRGFSRTASAFTAETDCLLEESGFELAVPSERSVAKQETAPLCRLPRVLGKARSGPVDMFQGVSITEATSAMNAAWSDKRRNPFRVARGISPLLCHRDRQT
jgi:hypothetical protein